MHGKRLAAIALSTAWAFALSGCVIPEQVSEAPAPQVPDEGLVIQEIFPASSSVPATATANGGCTVTIQLPQVLDPSGAPVTARVFLNLFNPYADQSLTEYPLNLGGETDILLARADENSPNLFALGNTDIDLADFLPYLAGPNQGTSEPNVLSVYVSDGFSIQPNEPLYEPASGESAASATWNIDLTNCPRFDLP
jgi:hypothetical protein